MNKIIFKSIFRDKKKPINIQFILHGLVFIIYNNMAT